MRKPLWQAQRQGGRPRFGMHTQRHAAARHVVVEGTDMRTVQYLLGQSDSRTTLRIYVRVLSGKVAQVVETCEMTREMQGLFENRGYEVVTELITEG